MSSIPASTLPVGFGIMNYTGIPSHKFTQDEFNASFKEILESSGASSTKPLFINGGEFYGIPDRHEGLKVLGGFFKAYPELADSVYVSIKAGTSPDWQPDNSKETLDKAVSIINEYLEPLYAARKHLPKALDMFTLARISKEPVEDTMRILQSHVENKNISSICLSEVAAPTVARAISVAPLGAIEIEFSLFAHDATDNGSFKVCAENNIPIVCYSPLGKGMLVGMKLSDLPKEDFRHNFDRFNDPEVVKHNENLVENIKQFSSELNITPAQFCLSWITSSSGIVRNGQRAPRSIPIPGSTNPKRMQENFAVQKLDDQVSDKVDSFFQNFKTAGYRYNKIMDQANSK